jgi:hypothetical protein
MDRVGREERHPRHRSVLHAAAARFDTARFDTWYVYFGVIDPAKIAECVDMDTGLAVEGWRDTPEGRKPVPPERRHLWHKKLMKELRRQMAA